MLPSTSSRVPAYGFVQIGILLTITSLLTSGIIPVHEYGKLQLSHSAAAPTYRATTATEASHSQPESILFLGDVLLARDVERRQQRYGYRYPFAGLDFTAITSQPYVVANFEAAIPEVHKPTPNMSTRFSVDSATLPALRKAGVTHVSLANNHSFDFGAQGYQHTRTTLSDHDLIPFGHPQRVEEADVQYITLASGHTVAVIGINAVFTEVPITTLQVLMDSVKQRSDVQIAYLHWGTEYELVHDDSQREIAALLVDEGFDLIIGHHPHVVQDIDLIAGVPVIYSLGNHVFDQYFSQAVQEGLMVSLQHKGSFTLNLHPVTSVVSLNQPQLLEDEARASFLADLAKRSHPELRAQIIAGALNLTEPLARTTKTAMMVE